jgi:hypothetical protein
MTAWHDNSDDSEKATTATATTTMAQEKTINFSTVDSHASLSALATLIEEEHTSIVNDGMLWRCASNSNDKDKDYHYNNSNGKINSKSMILENPYQPHVYGWRTMFMVGEPYLWLFNHKCGCFVVGQPFLWFTSPG